MGPAGASDELAFTGLSATGPQVFFNGNQVSFDFLAGATSGTYTLFTFDTAGAYQGRLQAAGNYTFQYNPNDITVTVAAAPEPSAWLLACCAAAAFCWARRRAA